MIDKYLLLARSNINEYVKKAIFDVYQNNIEDGLKILNKIATYVPSIQDIKTEIAVTLRNNCSFIPINDSSYPTLLKNIPSAPIVLTVRGNKKNLLKNIIAIAGTREPENDDFFLIQQISKMVGEIGFIVASGLARGSDCIAHLNSIQSGTMAIMAHGLNMCYPKDHKILFDKILDNNGTIISEYSWYTRPAQLSFVKRNRILTGISLATIIARARKQKCGTIITAEYEKKFNRPLYTILPKGENLGNLYLLKTNIAKQITNLEILRYNLLFDCLNANKKIKKEKHNTVLFCEEEKEKLDIEKTKFEILKILKINKINKLTQNNFIKVYNLILHSLNINDILIKQCLLEISYDNN